MNITLIDFDASHYATNLTQKGDSLKWESVGATHYLMIRDRFGVEIKLTDDDIKQLSQADAITREAQTRSNRCLTLLERCGINTCPITVKPAAYAIFACELKDGGLTIYNPSEACFYWCQVSATIRISIEKAPVENKGFFNKIFSKTKQNEQSYYNVSFPQMPDYINDLLCYTYEGCEYKFPITRQMVNKTVLIPDCKGEPPMIKSLDSNAYKVIIEGNYD
jgi:hypothetical protein